MPVTIRIMLQFKETTIVDKRVAKLIKVQRLKWNRWPISRCPVEVYLTHFDTLMTNWTIKVLLQTDQGLDGAI